MFRETTRCNNAGVEDVALKPTLDVALSLMCIPSIAQHSHSYATSSSQSTAATFDQ